MRCAQPGLPLRRRDGAARLIAVDSSALLAIVLVEALGDACAGALAEADAALISTPSLTETLIVTSRRGVDGAAERLLGMLNLEVVPLTAERARHAAAAYRRWGKGFHPARLNYGDCFAYALAREFDCPLLYVGDDFARTDVRSALG